jgi:hypothetical protein
MELGCDNQPYDTQHNVTQHNHYTMILDTYAEYSDCHSI